MNYRPTLGIRSQFGWGWLRSSQFERTQAEKYPALGSPFLPIAAHAVHPAGVIERIAHKSRAAGTLVGVRGVHAPMPIWAFESKTRDDCQAKELPEAAECVEEVAHERVSG